MAINVPSRNAIAAMELNAAVRKATMRDDTAAPIAPAPSSYAMHQAIIAMTLRSKGNIGHKRAEELASAVTDALAQVGWLKRPGL